MLWFSFCQCNRQHKFNNGGRSKIMLFPAATDPHVDFYQCQSLTWPSRGLPSAPASLPLNALFQCIIYRIRKRLALSLPIRDSLPPAHTVRAFSSPNPWSIWLKWALENHMLALGKYDIHMDDTEARSALVEDLSALAAWKTQRNRGRTAFMTSLRFRQRLF